MDCNTIRALCVGWTCAGIALVVTEVTHLPLVTALVVIFIAGGASTLYVLNRE